jgi:hypothetical protein
MFNRSVINTLLPGGSAWSPVTDGDFDKLLDGIGENSDVVFNVLDDIRNIRNPLETPVLTDLEHEYGVIPVAGATDSERRDRLKTFMFRRGELPTYTRLNERLQSAGFDVQVHPNSPAVDPNIFLAQAFNMVCNDLLPGGNDPQCGEPEAVCAQVGGLLLVNGDIFTQAPNYSLLCDELLAQCGEALAFAGQFDSIRLEAIDYEVPTDPGYWPLIFFVGGAATRDPVTDELTEIEIAPIPIARKSEFQRIILTFKPMFSWAGLIVVYV